MPISLLTVSPHWIWFVYHITYRGHGFKAILKTISPPYKKGIEQSNLILNEIPWQGLNLLIRNVSLKAAARGIW